MVVTYPSFTTCILRTAGLIWPLAAFLGMLSRAEPPTEAAANAAPPIPATTMTTRVIRMFPSRLDAHGSELVDVKATPKSIPRRCPLAIELSLRVDQEATAASVD